ncbi:MAG TPA: response regulator [Roseiflexaceae bacterium]|nr:response regulator [Roseiflexaceae bacterium]
MYRTTPCILIVEDDPAVQAMLQDLLADAGYITCSCATAQDAQYLIAMQHVDLCILDMHLLGRQAGGMDVLALARLVPATKTLPIIVCSADTPFLDVNRDELLARQCVILAKPFDIELLLATIETSLDMHCRSHAVGE